MPRLSANTKVVLGDFYRGQTVVLAEVRRLPRGGRQGRRRSARSSQGLALSLAAAKAQIDNGGATMPGKLVTGQPESDVLAFLATILAPRVLERDVTEDGPAAESRRGATRRAVPGGAGAASLASARRGQVEALEGRLDHVGRRL